MTTKVLGERKLEPRAKALVAEAVREVLEDPDFGFELTARAKRRLNEALRARGRGVPLAEIMAKYS